MLIFAIDKTNDMKTFTTLNVASKIKNSNTKEVVTVYKVRKDGTKRVFFKPVVEIEGKELMITRTLWATLWEAEKLAKAYLNRNN